VDVDRGGLVREPSEVTVAEVREQLDRARRAASAAEALLEAGALAKLADPNVAAVDFSRAVASAFSAARYHRSPEAAGAVLLKTASMLQS
jgi:hypothetical protein